MVLYNGDKNWTAAKSFKEILSGYENFDNLILDFSYFLFDVNRYEPEDLMNLRNIVGSIFLLDQKYDIMELDDRLKSIAEVLQKIDPRQFHLFTQWFNNIVSSNLSKENLDNVVMILENTSPEEVEKVISNLGETIKKAQEEAEQRGLEKGMEKGIKQGIEKGIEQGIEQGSKNMQIEIAKNLLKSDLPFELIAKATKLSLEEIHKIAAEMDYTITK